MPRITRPQVYRVVREMPPRERFGRLNCCGGWRRRKNATNGPGAPMPSAEPPFAHPRASLLEPSL